MPLAQAAIRKGAVGVGSRLPGIESPPTREAFFSWAGQAGCGGQTCIARAALNTRGTSKKPVAPNKSRSCRREPS
jgi:hypothetical protein